MSNYAASDAGTDRIYDNSQNYETVANYAPIQFADDFLGAGYTASLPAMGSPVIGCPWVAKVVKTAGSPSAAAVANAAGGQIALALDATSEKQEATLTWNDSLALDASKYLNFEARVALSVAPSATGVQAVFGLSTAWIDGPDNATQLIQFGCKANNNLSVRLTDKSGLVTTAAALLAQPSTQLTLDTNFHILRIDATSPADVKFFLDGARVNQPNSVAFTTTGSGAILQPYLSVYKPSGTGVATLTVDAVRAWNKRQ